MLKNITQKLRDGAQRLLQRQALSGWPVLRLLPSLSPSRYGLILETALATAPDRDPPAGLDLLLGRRLGLNHAHAPLLTFDDAAQHLERGDLLDVLEKHEVTGVALIDPDHLDDPHHGLSRHTLRWMLGAGVIPGLWISNALQRGGATALHRAVHVGASRLKSWLHLPNLWIGTDALHPSPWLQTFAPEVGASHILTARPGLWPLPQRNTHDPQEICRITVDPLTSPADLYDLLLSSPTAQALALTRQRLTNRPHSPSPLSREARKRG
jgi:hypothetical protein